MNVPRQASTDPVVIETSAAGADIEIVVPYTEWGLAEAVLDRAVALSRGLRAAVRLVAVHPIPYPQPFYCPPAQLNHLAGRLADLASRCPLAADPQVVLARYWDEGFRRALKPASIVVIGVHRRLWPTREEKLARLLTRDGHNVVLVDMEG